MSAETSLKSNIVKIEIDTTELSPQQVRLIKSINTMLAHIVQTEDEDQYFEGSVEVMRMCASLIKQANFNDQRINPTNIPYAQQALEYALDVLQEYVTTSKVVNYDN